MHLGVFIKGYWATSTNLVHEGGHVVLALRALRTEDPAVIQKYRETAHEYHGYDRQYQPALYRSNDALKLGQSPAIITNPYGFAIYGSGNTVSSEFGVLGGIKPDDNKDYYKYEFLDEKK